MNQEIGTERVTAGVPTPNLEGPPRRIVHVFEIGQVGGQFRVVESLARAQMHSGLLPAVVPVAVGENQCDHPILESLRYDGVEVEPILLDRPRAYLSERARVVEAARRLGADIVHTHGYRADVVDGTATRRHGFPTVATLHGFTGGGVRNRLYEQLQRLVVRRFDAVVAVSEPMQKALLAGGFPRDRLHVVRNAVVSSGDIASRKGALNALGLRPGFHIGWIGRVSHEKGPDVLLDAIDRVPGPVVGSVLGDGPLRATLQERTDRERLPVVWHGVVHHADALYRAFDCIVISSRTEGTPMVLLEAMRASVPVVATRVGGIPDVVSEREAWLVPPEDPTSIANAIEEIRRDTTAAAERTRAGYERLRREFSTERWVEEHQRVYRKAVGHYQGSR